MEKNLPNLNSFLVDTPELEQEYSKIVLTVFSEQGREKEEILGEEKGAEIYKMLIEFDSKFVGAGRVVRSGKLLTVQRISILKQFRHLGIYSTFAKLGLDFIHKIKQPQDTVQLFVNVFSLKIAERTGYLIDYSNPMRLDASPFIYYKGTLPKGE